MNRAWHLSRGGQPEGPFDLEALGALAAQGELNAEHRVCEVGQTQWVPVTAIPEIRNALGLPGTVATQESTRRLRRILVIVAAVVGGLFILAVALATAKAHAYRKAVQSQMRHDSRHDALAIKQAADSWLLDHPSPPGACPTIDELRAEGILPPSAMLHDSWGHEFTILCRGAVVSVTSPGPDGRLGTEDDIVDLVTAD